MPPACETHVALHRLRKTAFSRSLRFYLLFFVCIFIYPITSCKIKSFHHKNVGMAYIRNLICVYISNFDWVDRQTWNILSLSLCACVCVFDSGSCSMLSHCFFMIRYDVARCRQNFSFILLKYIIALIVSDFSSRAHHATALTTNVASKDTRK